LRRRGRPRSLPVRGLASTVMAAPISLPGRQASAQPRARASRAISGPGRAYSVARAGRDQTAKSSAGATAERRPRVHARASGTPAALWIRMNNLTMRSF
jgi:hypothetical protein